MNVYRTVGQRKVLFSEVLLFLTLDADTDWTYGSVAMETEFQDIKS